MNFYTYEPEVSGLGYGENTVYVGEKTAHPCVVSHLHYEFNYWPDDDMQATIFHYIGTERLRQALEAMQPPVTGIEFDEVEISGDEDEFEHTWREGRPDSALGKWYWFKITGQAGRDDFGGGPTEDLVISERVVEVLKRFTVINSVRKIRPWGGEIEAGRVPQKGMPATGES
jgi:hypothetical protein